MSMYIIEIKTRVHFGCRAPVCFCSVNVIGQEMAQRNREEGDISCDPVSGHEPSAQTSWPLSQTAMFMCVSVLHCLFFGFNLTGQEIREES